MSTKPLPLGPHQAYPPGGIIVQPPNPWSDPRLEATPAALPPPPAPYVPPDSPYSPDALTQPVGDTSPVFAAASTPDNTYVKGVRDLHQAYPPGGIVVEAPNPWGMDHPDPTEPVVVDGVPLNSIWGDPNSAMGPNAPPLNLDFPNAAPEEPPLDEGAPASNPVDTTGTGVDGTFLPTTFESGFADTGSAAVVTDPTTAAVLDPNAAPAIVTSGSAISGWWLVAIGIAVWYFWFRKGKK